MGTRDTYDFSVEGRDAHYGDDLIEKPGFFSRLVSFFSFSSETPPVDDEVIVEGADQQPHIQEGVQGQQPQTMEEEQEEKTGMLSRMYDWSKQNAEAGVEYASKTYGQMQNAVQESFVGRAKGIDSVSRMASSSNNAVAKKREDYSGFRGTIFGNWLCNSAVGRFFGADNQSFEERRAAYSAAKTTGLEASSYLKNNAIGRMFGVDDIHQNYAQGFQYDGSSKSYLAVVDDLDKADDAIANLQERLAKYAQRYSDAPETSASIDKDRTC